ncbi:ribokinase [Pararhizobium antarcticum]|uniref:Ribokinase n=1 Tax=Pararhizobium antarcticum TaxID=1798805 RepID=A0A657LRS4_9HYPH|nr:ribokinase [Pararhizobium antarcticum]OJF96381.1 ribokinase [Pararhizobium antarcticum]OJF96712.1 ribokinase [Rhizobium sp. 58]
MRVHVVGNVCIDTTFRLDRFPEGGETRNAISHEDGLGGKGANQGVAAARTRAPVTLWAAVGRDANGAWIAEALSAEIGCASLTEFDLPSDRSTIAVDATGENIILSGVACALAFDPLSHTPLLGRIEPGDVIVMQGNLSAAVTEACLTAARAKGARTVLNASPLAEGAKPRLDMVDSVIVNEGEARALSGCSSPAEAAARLIDLGARSAIVTLGSRGCLLLDGVGCEPVLIEAPKVSAVDTSGAGDVLCGVFSGCLAKGMTLQAALMVAVAASALAVTRAGTLASCPSVDEISGLIRKSETEHA